MGARKPGQMERLLLGLLAIKIYVSHRCCTKREAGEAHKNPKPWAAVLFRGFGARGLGCELICHDSRKKSMRPALHHTGYRNGNGYFPRMDLSGTPA